MNTIQKANISLFIDDQNEPIGMIYFNKNRERVIYMIDKADEDQITGLFEGKNCTSKKLNDFYIETIGLTEEKK